MSPPPARRAAPLLALLLAGPAARADGTAVWLSGAVDPGRVEASTHTSAASLATDAPWTERDDAAIAALRRELTEVRPLLDQFDGELVILRRLDAAIDAVQAIRAEDRALLVEARAFQGLAAERYFQARLATDPAAAPWRVELPDGAGGTLVVNRPTADAVALDPESLPGPEVVPDDEARLAYQQLRARLLVAPTAAVIAVDLPSGGRLLVDGVPSATDRARVVPGEHRLAVEVDGVIRLRAVARIPAGETLELRVPASAAELQALADALEPAAALPLPPRVATALAPLEPPVTLVVTARGGVSTWRVADGAAIALLVEPTAAAEGPGEGGLSLRASLSQAWIHDGEWYLQNAGSGAPATVATVNGTAPGLHLGVQQRWGLLAVGAGVDARWTFGQWQDLRVGTHDWRARLYPHAAVGLPWVQLTAGAWLPWRLGLGARAHLPLGGPLEATAGALYGVGLPYDTDQDASFTPSAAASAWGGLSVRLGR